MKPRRLAVQLLSLSLAGGGIVVNGARVLTRADGPCYPSSADSDRDHRIVDCGNGTVTDMVTGAVWLPDAACAGPLDWWDAHEFARKLEDGQCGLSDRSQAGDWRLPTLWEVEELVRDARDRMACTGTPPCDVAPGNAPALPNGPGDQCLVAGPGSWTGVTADAVVWTGTTVESDPTKAFVVSLCTGMPAAAPKSTTASRLLLPVFTVDTY